MRWWSGLDPRLRAALAALLVVLAGLGVREFLETPPGEAATFVPTPPRLTGLAARPDIAARGSALRADLESFFVSVPPPKRRDWLGRLFTGAPWLGLGPSDASDIFRHFIPDGTSFAEAEAVLAAAGIPLFAPRPTAAERERLTPSDDWPIEAMLQTLIGQPPTHLHLLVKLRPLRPGMVADDDPVGRIEAGLARPVEMSSPPIEFLAGVDQPWRVEAPLRIEDGRDYHFAFGLRGSRIDDLHPPRGHPPRGPVAGPQPAVVVPIRLEVWTADLASPVLDRTFDATGDRRGGRLHALRIAEGVRLSPGQYLVRATALAPVPEAAGERVNLVIR